MLGIFGRSKIGEMWSLTYNGGLLIRYEDKRMSKSSKNVYLCVLPMRKDTTVKHTANGTLYRIDA